MVMIRGGGGGTAPLQIESGRWRGLAREERVCRECERGEVEDVNHWLLSCPALAAEREDLLADIADVSTEFQDMGEEEQVAIYMYIDR